MQRRSLVLAGAAGTVVVGLLLIANSVATRSSSSAGGKGRSSSSSSSSKTAQPSLPGAAARADNGPRYASFDCGYPAGDAARVDGAGIPLAELCDQLRRIGAVTPKGTERVQARTVLDRMIDAVLVNTALEREKAGVTKAEMDAALRELPPRIGADVELITAQLRDRVALKKLVEKRTSLAVTEYEVDAELLDGAPGIDRGQGVRVEGYIARMTPGADENAARERAEKFADVGDKTPEAAAAAKMTPLPEFTVGASGIEPELQEAAFGLKNGKWSGALRTRVGWAVIRVVESEKGIPIEDMPSIRARVRRALETRKLQAAQQRLLEQLREAARIEYIVTL